MRNRTQRPDKKRPGQPIVDTEEMKRQVHLEINAQKVNIDRSVFAKTPEEKEEVRLARNEWRKWVRKPVAFTH